MKRDQCWLDRDCRAWLEFGFACWAVYFATNFPVTLALLAWFGGE